MNGLIWALRVLAIAFIAVSGLHLFLGLYADAMLGVPVTPEMASNPSFDSPNRFYGVTFSLLGVALLVAATDLKRYEPMVVATLGVTLPSFDVVHSHPITRLVLAGPRASVPRIAWG